LKYELDYILSAIGNEVSPQHSGCTLLLFLDPDFLLHRLFFGLFHSNDRDIRHFSNWLLGLLFLFLFRSPPSCLYRVPAFDNLLGGGLLLAAGHDAPVGPGAVPALAATGI